MGDRCVLRTACGVVPSGISTAESVETTVRRMSFGQAQHRQPERIEARARVATLAEGGVEGEAIDEGDHGVGKERGGTRGRRPSSAKRRSTVAAAAARRATA